MKLHQKLIVPMLLFLCTLASVRQVCIIKDCFVLHFYRWAELIPWF